MKNPNKGIKTDWCPLAALVTPAAYPKRCAVPVCHRKAKELYHNLIERLLVGLLICAFAVAGLRIADYFVVDPVKISGVVVGMDYAPAKTGFSIVKSESDTWTLILNVSGEYKTFEVPAKTFYNLTVGDETILTCNRGRIFGTLSSCH